MTAKNHLLHIVLNHFTNDSRVEKEIKSLSANGNSVSLFALHDGLLPLKEEYSYGVLYRFQLVTRSWPRNKIIQLLKYLECLIRMVSKGFGMKPQCVHAHDLNALPIGFLVSRLRGIPLIYDAHEFETEQSENPNRLLHFFSVVLERFLVKRADAVINVSRGIADAYVERYGIGRPSLVLNSPPFAIVTKCDLFREKLGIDPGRKIFLYQGALHENRGLDKLMDAFAATARHDAVLVVMGYGELSEQVELMASRHANIYYHPAVAPSEVLSYTSSADIGLCIIPNSCLSYYYCLPNKFFEYAMAGLPMLVSNLAEIGRMVHEYECGHVIEDESPEGITNAIDRILSSDLDQYGANSRKLALHYNWEEQEKVLLSVYRKVLSCAV